MMNENIIQKQILHLDVQTPVVSAFAMQEAATKWCSDVLVVAIGRRLEKYSEMEEVICIDSIELQLNVTESVDEILADKIAMEVEKKIQAIVQAAMLLERSASGKERSVFEAFVFFLQNGYLPWWSSIKNVEDLMPLQKLMTGDQQKMLKALFKEELIRARFTNLLPDDIFFAVPAHVFEVSEQQVNSLFQKISKLALLIEDKNLQYQFSILIKQEFIKALAYNKSEALVTSRAVDLLLNKYQVSAEVITRFIQTETLLSKEVLFENISANQTIDAPVNIHDDVVNCIIEVEQTKKTSRQKQQTGKRDGIYISDAGLVLLAPFIPRFFENLGIVENQNFNSKDLAVTLLQWLVTGDELCAEFNLVLPKIVCGMEPEEPVVIIPHLPEGFKKEGETLLQSVIENWSILKNTSVEGLRESFLQREGKLSFQKDEWLLQVEQKPYDMLLEHLPWNINMIRLSWMQYLLRTEWVG